MRPTRPHFLWESSGLLLVKRTPGKPLTPAEMQQRRNAARARWAAAAGGTALGAVSGAIIGGASEAVLSGARARAAAEEAGLAGLRAAYVARQAVQARRGDKYDQVRRFYEDQLRTTPARDRPTLQQAIESLRNPQGGPVARRVARTVPIIGNVQNRLIYARQLWQAQRRLVLARREVEAVVQRNMAAGDDRESAEASPEARRARVEQ